MKIAFFIDGPATGGGYYSMMNFVNIIKNIKSKKKKLIFITQTKAAFELLKKKGLSTYFYKPSLLEKFNLKLNRNKFLSFFFELINCHNVFYKFVKKKNVDFIIFNEPSIFILYCKKINFATCIFNTEIDLVKNFSEFNNGNYEKQKKIIEFSVEFAKKIIVFTKKNKDDLINKYDCLSSKILIQNLIPYLPKIYSDNLNFNYKKFFRNKFKYKTDIKFIFYPAQFWEHKNHKLLLNIAKLFKINKIYNIIFIFSGTDRGNLQNIKKKVNQEKLNDTIIFLGPITEIELISVYLNCNSVIMPTYLGRSSLPLLESLYFNKPIFYNKNILDNQLKKYTIGIDADNAKTSFLKIKKIILSKKISNGEPANTRKVYKKLCSKKNFLKTYQNLIETI